jgi:hypothetical protein
MAPLVLIWGDSHADDLVPGLRAVQLKNNFRLAEYTSSLCAPIVGLTVPERPECHSINDAVMNHIRILKPDIVVLSALWGFKNGSHTDFDEYRAEELRQTIAQLRAAGVKRVVVIGSAPEWKEAVPTLLIHEARLSPGIPVSDTLPRTLLAAQDQDDQLQAAAVRAGATFVPLFAYLCDRADCLVTTAPDWHGVMVYDTAHFTPNGSVVVIQRILPEILRESSPDGSPLPAEPEAVH